MFIFSVFVMLEWEFGIPWENSDKQCYDKWDPSQFVANWKTPTLVIQGGKDYRVPETESLGAFTALQRLGVPSRLMYFPDENHWVLRPMNSLKWHKNVFNWLEQWLGKNENEESPLAASPVTPSCDF